MDNKRILVLGAGVGQVPLIKRSKSEGWYTIVVSPPGEYPGFELADECCYADISNVDSVLKIAVEKHISAIATDQTDISVPTVCYVAEFLGLPHIDCEDVRNFQLKSLMRDMCSKKSLQTIPYLVTSNVCELEDFFNSIPNREAIMKPIDSQGSRGIKKIRSIEELREAFNYSVKYSRKGEVIIENFVDGQEIEVDTVIFNGQIKGVLIGDVRNFVSSNTFSSYERIYPTQLPDDIQNRIKQINAKTICALGIRTGWLHGEYIMTKEGDVLLIEVGARGGGNWVGSDIVRMMLGIGTDEMAFKTAIGDFSFYQNIKFGVGCCACKSFMLPCGVIESINIDRDFLSQPCIITHNLDSVIVGNKTHENTDKTSRYTIVLQTQTRNELDSLLQVIPEKIRVRVKTEEGEQEAIWK